MTDLTIKEKAQRWVAEMNAFPQEMIETLMKVDIDSWHEVTKPVCKDVVFVNVLPDKDELRNKCSGEGSGGEIIKILDNRNYIIKLLDETTIIVPQENFELERMDFLPMWGTMWSFNNFLDVTWIKTEEGQRVMSECGFRIYQHDDWDFFYGIDGAGYDFYTEHWIPLYKKRGLL